MEQNAGLPPVSPATPPAATTSAPAAPGQPGMVMAIASLSLGVIALILMLLPVERTGPHFVVTGTGLALAIAGVVCGHIALARARSGSAAVGLSVAALAICYITGAIGVAHLLGIALLAAFLRHQRGG